MLDTLPFAAATGAAEVLMDLFIVLLAAMLGHELFKRLGQPTLAGEILAGVLIGPSILGLVEPGEVLEVFAELGVVFLLFWIGLENRLSKLKDVGRVAVTVGGGGIAVPFAGGVALGLLLGHGLATALFLGAALSTTSTAITSATMLDLGLIRSSPARIMLGAAIVDDILALILIAIAIGTSDGSIDAVQILVVTALAIGFVLFFAVGGTRLLAARPQMLKEPEFAKTPLLPAVLICLGLAALAAQVGLAAIIGAFLAGLMVAETKEHEPVEHEIAPLYAFFPPFFFVFIGLSLNLSELTSAEALGLLALITTVAIVTKFIGAYLGGQGVDRHARRLIGVGMIPRGEVGIIAAGLGLTAGVITEQLFAIVVAMSLITTLVVPLVLPRLATADKIFP